MHSATHSGVNLNEILGDEGHTQEACLGEKVPLPTGGGVWEPPSKKITL